MAFYVNGTTTIVTTDGKLGIGTNTPAAFIHIVSSLSNDGLFIRYLGSGKAINVAAGTTSFYGDVNVYGRMISSNSFNSTGDINTSGKIIVTNNSIYVWANSTYAGLNMTAVNGDPSANANGDVWINSSTGKFKYKILGSTFTPALLELENNFSSGIKINVSHNSTNAGLKIAPSAGNPSTRANGDVWINSSTPDWINIMMNSGIRQIGRMPTMNILTAQVSSTYNLPSNVKAIFVEAVGAGGGAGNGDGQGAGTSIASIAGGGADAVQILITNPSSSYTYSCGFRGNTSGGTIDDGPTGGNTLFTDGTLTVNAVGGCSGSGILGTSGSSSNFGVVPVNRASVINGNGTEKIIYGIPASAIRIVGGIFYQSSYSGYNPLFGGSVPPQSSADGLAAAVPGAGGGAFVETGSSANRIGGLGANGIIRITEFY